MNKEEQLVGIVDLTEQTIAQLVVLEEPGEVKVADVRAYHNAQIERLKEEFAGIKVADISSKEEYDRLQKAITHVTGVATGIGKQAKEFTKPWYEAKKVIDDYANDLEGRLRAAVLDPLKAEKDRVLKERERLAKEEQETRQAIINGRIALLNGLSMVLVGQFYEHRRFADIRMASIEVSALDAPDFVERVNAIKDSIDSASMVLMIKGRRARLTELGAHYDQGSGIWTLGDTSVGDSDIASNNLDFDGMVAKMTAAVTAQREAEQRQREEEDKARREREAEAERKMNDALDMRFVARKQCLLMAGCEEYDTAKGKGYGIAMDMAAGVFIPHDILRNMDDAEFNEKLVSAKEARVVLDDMNAAKERADARQRKLNDRMHRLGQAGWAYRAEDGEPEPGMVLYDEEGKVIAACIIDGETGLIGVSDDKIEEWEHEGRMAQDRKHRKQARLDLITDRVKRLKEAGWYEVEHYAGPTMDIEFGGIGNELGMSFFVDTIASMDDVEFGELVAMGQAELARREEERQAKLKAEAEEAARKKMAEEAAAKAKEEEDRKAKLSDLEKWDEWVSGIEKSAPAMSSAIGKHAVENLVHQVKRMRESISKDL